MFYLGPIPIRSYGLMMMIGFLVAIHLASRRARKCGADEETVVNLGLLSLISGIIGARVFYVIHHWSQFAIQDNPIFAAFNLTAGGLEFYGGFLTAVAAVIIYMWAKGRSMRWYLDILVPSVMIGLAFGRVGCLLNGCCWGKPTACPVAIQFPYGSLAFEHQWQKTHEVKVPAELILITPSGSPFLVDRDHLGMTDEQLKKDLAKATPNTNEGYYLGLLNGHLQAFHTSLADLRKIIRDLNLKTVPIHPTQIYASLTAFLLGGFLSIYFWHRKRDGMVIAWCFVLYPITRVIEEYLRADNPLDTFGLTVSQGISLASIPLALLFMLLLRYLPARSPKAVAELERRKAPQVARPVKKNT
jgi:phosphatidylglycerol---prolipoprotein diacylglyceryl transferase